MPLSKQRNKHIQHVLVEAAKLAQPKVDGPGSHSPGFQVTAIPKHHDAIERQPWLRTVPVHEFVDRMPIPALRVRAAQAVQNCRPACSRSSSRKTLFGRLFRRFRFMIRGLHCQRTMRWRPEATSLERRNCRIADQPGTMHQMTPNHHQLRDIRLPLDTSDVSAIFCNRSPRR